MEPAKISLQTGEKIAQTSSKLLDRRSRGNILFRIVGDNLHGCAKVAASWDGTVEAITHRVHVDHQSRAYFDLPCSIPVAQAHCPPFADSPWDGIILVATIHGGTDARDVGVLFEAWRPLIAILALPSVLSRKERNSHPEFK